MSDDRVPGGGGLVLVVVLLLLAGYLGHRDGLAWPLLLVAVPPAVLMYVSFESEQPLEWAFATLVIAAGALLATAVGRRFRPRRDDPTDGLLCAHRQWSAVRRGRAVHRRNKVVLRAVGCPVGMSPLGRGSSDHDQGIRACHRSRTGPRPGSRGGVRRGRPPCGPVRAGRGPPGRSTRPS
ncbi:hypothetical protein ACRAWF_44595 [Streptomyces sp. L7]